MIDFAALRDRARGRTPGRKARRRARAERWRRPLETSRDRREAWGSLLFADHGFLRLAYRNRHQVTERLWRSAQPSPTDIATAARLGIRTVVSLRADGFGGDPLEREACARHGLNFERVVLQSRMAPPKAVLRQAMEVFPRLEAPVLLHCKSGADRAGLGSALWMILVEGASAEEAQRQLSLKFGHIKHARTGVLDVFLEAWAQTGEAAGLSFAEWVETVYDPESLPRRVQANPIADALLSLMARE
ncbi:tyrosine-protein phosphatase [Acuticoccus sediminis]|uniref:tyrosine-protein phosphatase n=1 Tax=Acuticoccus sediminis TaxID=2184697 RepID=UPI001CFCBD85|nr:sulfur transferase domain-containing protein [Acuticoccus sediminis]